MVDGKLVGAFTGGKGFVGLSESEKGLAEVGVGFDVGGLEFDGSFAVGDDGRVKLETVAGEGAVGEEGAVCGIVLDGLGVVFIGAEVVLLLEAAGRG